MIFSTGVALASKKSKLLACLLAPFLWTALEFFRTNIPIIGSSWDLSGYPAARSMALLQITSVTGIYGLCFLIAAYGSLARLRGARRYPPRVEARRDCHHRAGRRRSGRPISDPVGHSPLRRAPGPNEFPAVRKLSGGLAADPRRQNSTSSNTSASTPRTAFPGSSSGPKSPHRSRLPEPPFAAARRTHRARLRELFSRRRGGLEAATPSGKWLASNSAVAAESRTVSASFVRQNSSAAVRRIRPAARLAHLCKKTHRGHFRFHSRLAIHRRAASARKIRHLHLLRSNFPQRSPPFHLQRRRIAGHDFE